MSNKRFESREIFDLGFAFLNAGEANFREGAIKNRSDYQNVAGVVNLAFACELFIKCLLNMAESKPCELKDHKLDELWAKFKEKRKKEAVEIEAVVMSELATDFSFEKMLHDDSDVFINFRYIYEPDRIAEIRDKPLRLQFLRVFVSALYRALHEKIALEEEKHNQGLLNIAHS